MSKHTPGEWTKNPKNGRIVMAGAVKVLTCHPNGPQAWEDAAFVRQACNLHDELVAALAGLLGSRDTDYKSCQCQLPNCVECQARAVLAKVAEQKGE